MTCKGCAERRKKIKDAATKAKEAVKKAIKRKVI